MSVKFAHYSFFSTVQIGQRHTKTVAPPTWTSIGLWHRSVATLSIVYWWCQWIVVFACESLDDIQKFRDPYCPQYRWLKLCYQPSKIHQSWKFSSTNCIFDEIRCRAGCCPLSCTIARINFILFSLTKNWGSLSLIILHYSADLLFA